VGPRSHAGYTRGALAQPGEYDGTIGLGRRRGLTSNYYDHYLMTETLFTEL